MKKIPDFITKPRKMHNHKPKEKMLYDTIIIGAGIAGYSAAMYASRLGLKVLVIGEMSGGKVTLTETIENYPGFVSIKGIKLAELVENHAMDYDIHILTDTVERVSRKRPEGSFIISTSNRSFTGKTLIITTGTVEKKLNVPGEKEFTGNGVSYCAICDATMTKGRNVVVVGGGDSAVKEANLLAQYAKKVYIINNEAELHAESYNMKALQLNMKKGKVIPFNSSSVVSIDGKGSVSSMMIKRDGKAAELLVSWVFIYIGQVPRIVGKELGFKTNNRGEIIVDTSCRTSVSGVYAAGDVTSTSWKQAIIAAAQGVTAAYSAYNDISEKI